MCKIAEMELTHPMAMASSADTLRRCFKQRANGGNDERDLRAERSGVFDPGDRPGVGHIAQHGASVPEVARVDATHVNDGLEMRRFYVVVQRFRQFKWKGNLSVRAVGGWLM